jgi:hypothetical protein
MEEAERPTHRITLRNKFFHNATYVFEVHARDNACAMIAAQLKIQELEAANKLANKYEIAKVLEYAPPGVPGGRARFTFNVDLIPEGEDHE